MHQDSSSFLTLSLSLICLLVRESLLQRTINKNKVASSHYHQERRDEENLGFLSSFSFRYLMAFACLQLHFFSFDLFLPSFISLSSHFLPFTLTHSEKKRSRSQKQKERESREMISFLAEGLFFSQRKENVP